MDGYNALDMDEFGFTKDLKEEEATYDTSFIDDLEILDPAFGDIRERFIK